MAFAALFTIGLIAVALSPEAAAASAASAEKKFDVPAGDAAATLQRFSAQSGMQLLFSTEEVKGVTTKAVRGDLPAHEALDRMLAGTTLSATRDAASGALAVGKAANDPNAQRAARTASARPPGQSTLDTDEQAAQAAAEEKAKRAVVTNSPSDRAARPAARAGDDVLRLSPFEVQTDRDTGFAATSSLAGGRLATELRDTPVAYSVI
ncbi:MAG: secretin and TonB N-terminal domain-containing protein, partial [Opitutaceae bacterium]